MSVDEGPGAGGSFAFVEGDEAPTSPSSQKDASHRCISEISWPKSRTLWSVHREWCKEEGRQGSRRCEVVAVKEDEFNKKCAAYLPFYVRQQTQQHRDVFLRTRVWRNVVSGSSTSIVCSSFDTSVALIVRTTQAAGLTRVSLNPELYWVHL